MTSATYTTAFKYEECQPMLLLFWFDVIILGLILPLCDSYFFFFFFSVSCFLYLSLWYPPVYEFYSRSHGFKSIKYDEIIDNSIIKCFLSLMACLQKASERDVGAYVSQS